MNGLRSSPIRHQEHWPTLPEDPRSIPGTTCSSQQSNYRGANYLVHSIWYCTHMVQIYTQVKWPYTFLKKENFKNISSCHLIFCFTTFWSSTAIKTSPKDVFKYRVYLSLFCANVRKYLSGLGRWLSW